MRASLHCVVTLYDDRDSVMRDENGSILAGYGNTPDEAWKHLLFKLEQKVEEFKGLTVFIESTKKQLEERNGERTS